MSVLWPTAAAAAVTGSSTATTTTPTAWEENGDTDSVSWNDDDVENLSSEFTTTIQLTTSVPIITMISTIQQQQQQPTFVDEEASMLGLDLSASESESDDDVFMGKVDKFEYGLKFRTDVLEKQIATSVAWRNANNDEDGEEEDQCLFAGRVRTAERRSIHRSVLKRRSTICLEEPIPSIEYFETIRENALANLNHRHLHSKNNKAAAVKLENIRTLQAFCAAVNASSKFSSIRLCTQLIQNNFISYSSRRQDSVVTIQASLRILRDITCFHGLKRSIRRLQSRRKTPAISEEAKQIPEASKNSSLKKSRSLTQYLESRGNDYSDEVSEPKKKRIKWIDLDGTQNLENFEPVGSGSFDLNRQPLKPILKPTFNSIFQKQPKRKGLFGGLRLTTPRVVGKAVRIKPN